MERPSRYHQLRETQASAALSAFALYGMRTRQLIMKNEEKLKPLPALRTDEEVERFVDEADLTRYDLSSGSVARMESKTRPHSSLGGRIPRVG